MAGSLAESRKRLFASVLSDCLDAAGSRNQAMHARTPPLNENLVLGGRARTALYMEVHNSPPGGNAARDALTRGEKLAEVFTRHGIL